MKYQKAAIEYQCRQLMRGWLQGPSLRPSVRFMKFDDVRLELRPHPFQRNEIKAKLKMLRDDHH